MILVRDIRLPLSAGEEQARAQALHLLRLPQSKVRQMGVARLSVDARHGRPKLVYTIAVTLKDEGEEPAYAGALPCVALRQEAQLVLTPGAQTLKTRPVVCGLGPAGLFAALALAQQGFAPIVLERGPALEDRVRAVEHFSATGELDENANIQFGEGGAGTFSDGKLTTRIGDPLCDYVTRVFLAHGAPAEIAWQQKPHVGTDLLRGVIASIRREIEALGGEVRFGTALTGLAVRGGRLAACAASTRTRQRPQRPRPEQRGTGGTRPDNQTARARLSPLSAAHSPAVSCGVPCVIGKNGVENIIELPLTSDEQEQLQASCDVIRKHIALAEQIAPLD